ncbi:phospholipase D family protein [Pseudooceanicola marinus]|uniref:phospholipase D family protein n=1 Tax=Pseudooceanicola marinus TaxID=396013 RepID=UPI001CD44315|nr:phospholipase D family protein [Pseudooceanicola marinus]MCA1338028.1 phospholipase D family protein [Pseudooceanicola marinus]
MNVLDGPQLAERIRKEIGARENAKFAVAFWGNGAAEALGIGASTKMKAVCNLMSGGTNPDEIRGLLEQGAEVRQLNDLHAKIGVVGDLSFLGSSNMSSNGLGGEEQPWGWREANVVYDEVVPEILGMFEDYWARASEIKEADLAMADRLWSARRKGNAVVQAKRGRGLVQVLRETPDVLDRLNVRMVVYDRVTDEAMLRQFEEADGKAQSKYSDEFSTYMGWETIKEQADAYFVDYEWPARGGIVNGHIYRRDIERFPDLPTDGDFHVVHWVKDIEGIPFNTKDKAIIRKAFHSYEKQGLQSESENERCYNFPISKLRDFLPDDA